MSSLPLIVSILGAMAIGMISPGPSFVMVARTAVAGSRGAGLAAALGMGVGAAIFGALALAGVNAVLARVGWLYLGLKLAGGLYLLYLAICLWRGARTSLAVADAAEAGERRLGRAFRLGLTTQLSNPKTAVVYASVFAALLPPDASGWSLLVLPPAFLAMEAGWYGLVAAAFSSRGPRTLYLGAKHWIDRGASAVMGMLGIRLIWDAARSA